MNNAYLLIGGNTGDRKRYLAEARERINQAAGKIVKASQIYETAAWGKTDQASFLNQAIQLQTDLPATELLRLLLDIELQMGRERKERYGPRVIDIDIIFYEDAVIKTPDLTLPHPAMPYRRFVLMPLVEIAASYQHPVLKKDLQTLLNECDDPLAVIPMNN